MIYALHLAISQPARKVLFVTSRNDRIIVVGAGPVGLTAALALGRRGIATVLLASEPELLMELRGSTFHPPTLDLLDEFDLVPRMIEVGLKAPTWQFRDRETGPVATFDLSLLAGDTGHPYRVQCEQWKLMQFLHEKLRKLAGADIRFGHELVAVRQEEAGVTVTATTASGPVELTGRYVIGADGARSTVRRAAGIEFEGYTYPELFLVASTAFRFEEKLTDIAYVNYIADPHEWLVLLRVPELWRVRCRQHKMPTTTRSSPTIGCRGCSTACQRASNVMRSCIVRFIRCISAWRKTSGTVASCSLGTPRISTIPLAAWE
jgi:3-(3-hydroxy-phenyl)propionate hydroxylase